MRHHVFLFMGKASGSVSQPGGHAEFLDLGSNSGNQHPRILRLRCL